MDNSLLTQAIILLLGHLPGEIVATILEFATLIVTLSTITIRFWRKPNQNSKFYKIWKLIHIFAELKHPLEEIIEDEKNG